jgi:REP element-mobilizing transposase RayT
MVRPLRIQYPGAVYHVISRGNERKRIVRDNADREQRLDWLRRAVEIYGWHLHAFVLMTNHEHLFVETPQANLSAGMQYLNGSYTSYFNRRHRRAGHLFQGRYKGHLVEEEGYFLEISRYIHLNPVRAKMVASPEQYHWSSYTGFIRKRKMASWVCYEKVLGEFDSDRPAARRAYGRFVRAGIDQPPPSPFRKAIGGLLVGSEKFTSRIKRLLDATPDDREVPDLRRLKSRPTIPQILAAVADHYGYDQPGWAVGSRSDDAARPAAAYLARVRFGYSAKSVAKALNYRDSSGVSHAVKRIEDGTRKLHAAIDSLENKLR